MIRHAAPVPLWLRLAGLILVACLFIWIPFEDTHIQWVLILSVAICSWFAIRILLNLSAAKWQKVALHSLVGGLAGLAVAPLAFLLMAIKSGLHGHGTPDFTAQQIQTVFGIELYLAISGLLIGLGWGLWRAIK